MASFLQQLVAKKRHLVKSNNEHFKIVLTFLKRFPKHPEVGKRAIKISLSHMPVVSDEGECEILLWFVG